jgi:UDP-N-acetylmuramyl tripeptide synthase
MPGPTPTPAPTSAPISAVRPGLRSRVALLLGRVASRVSQLLGRGEGTVIGGEVALRLDRQVARTLAREMTVVLVSGTNGKTTTTRLIAEGLATADTVATNHTGSNLANGVVGALMRTPDAHFAALEVDEAVVPWALPMVAPEVVVLLNLSRDQLDRLHEVRTTADRWQAALATLRPRLVVANADDPLVTFAVGELPAVWVAAGLSWELDASACPWCGDLLAFGPDGWRCEGCGRARPACAFVLQPESIADGGVVTTPDGPVGLDLALPGRSAAANAAMALAAVTQFGVDPEAALERWRAISSIEGRYERVSYQGADLRLHLAKNPAGWADVLGLVGPGHDPVVLGFNAQVQDGRDPSWLWDVPFEVLAGRPVVCFGERATDLAVRLVYAEVEVQIARSLVEAAGLVGPGRVELIANYSAFQDVRSELARAR